MAAPPDLAKLNELLADRAYVSGTARATAEDIGTFEGVPVEPDVRQFPHVVRWHRHIAALRRSHAPYFEWPSSKAPKKGRAAGKEVKQLTIDCPVLKVEDREHPMDDPPPLGPGSQKVVGKKPASGRTFYITTAIHYANGYPHIGHAYENLVSDVFARYHRMVGEDVFFMTGNDEHGQKIATAAEEQNMKPIELCDKHVLGFRNLNQRLRISFDHYIRTTHAEHKEVAREVWRTCRERGDIYLGKYEGWYMVREERFVTDQEAEEMGFKDPGNGKPLQRMSEPSFFFRLSQYRDRVLKLIEDNEEFVQPQQYRKELLERLKSIELRDFSISRGTFDWGVPCPEDKVEGKPHVMYVWFDALINYVSGVNGNDPSKPLSRFWPANMHVVGKDIIWFHAVYWPAMLMSAGLAVPKSVVVHGFVLGPDGRKMSKSYGNVVNPHDELDVFPCDSIRWYLCRETQYGDDPKFSRESMKLMHNADLCDNLGNLVNRAVNLSGGSVLAGDPKLVKLPFDLKKLKAGFAEAVTKHRLSDAASLAVQAAGDTNKWIADLAPWKMKGEEDLPLKSATLRMLLESVYVLAHFFAPFVPCAADAIFKKLSSGPRPIPELSDNFLNLTDGSEVVSGAILFERLEVEDATQAAGQAGAGGAAASSAPAAKAKGKAEAKAGAKGGKGTQSEEPPADQPLISMMEFRVGRVVDAWNHPEADRLFVEKIDVGEPEGPRQIVSGLREHYKLEEIIGRKLLVVCNMKPAMLVKVESAGMVLCAKKDGVVELLDVPEGCQVGDRVLPADVPHTWAPLKPDKQKKKKVWEGVKDQLRTRADRTACFNGVPLATASGAQFLAPSKADAEIS